MRLIDADAFLKSEIERCRCVPVIGSCTTDNESFKEILNSQPTIDAVEVVRCKDCISYETSLCFSGGYCYHWDYEPGMSPNTVEEDDFCSHGERKEKQ